MIERSPWLVSSFALLACVACGSSPSDNGTNDGGAPPNDGAPPPSDGPGSTPIGEDRFGIGGTTVEQNDGITSALPTLPKLVNVHARVVGDSVLVDFTPVDGAKDYRVYALPNDADITTEDNGRVRVAGATYRCAGARPAPEPAVDAMTNASKMLGTVVSHDVGGYTRSLDEATLGYVYATAGAGRVPVYALGDPSPDGDSNCYWGRWQESRVKRYTTSATERTQLLAGRWRDDGIAFYAPATGGAPVYTTSTDNATFYYVDGAEAAVRTGGTVAFSALTAPGADTIPLKRVFYRPTCGNSHDELVGGEARFERALKQFGAPLTSLHWSGIAANTTIVVEALDALCPYRGQVAPASADAYDSGDLHYPAWLTLDALRAATPTHEVFINGQGDGTDPRAIARSFVTVSPTTIDNLDWFEGFAPGATMAPFSDMDCGEPKGNCWQQYRQASVDFDMFFRFVETPRRAFASVLGELWVSYADVGADVNGAFRIQPQTPANLDASEYLYVAMETDSFTTGRRYPQIIISDQPAPIDWNFEKGNSLVVQTFVRDTMYWPPVYEVQVCDHRKWDVNQQCPSFAQFHTNLDPNDDTKVLNLSPGVEISEHLGLDRPALWEVYASTKRVYLFMDGTPYGCADLPDAGVPKGAVNVTFGNVLYHSAVDDVTTITPFLGTHGQIETHRHLDNLGFKSGVTGPPWDEALMPCARANQMRE